MMMMMMMMMMKIVMRMKMRMLPQWLRFFMEGLSISHNFWQMLVCFWIVPHGHMVQYHPAVPRKQ